MMDHKGTAVLNTERLVLRPFRPSDAEAMYRNWASDDKVTEFLTWPTYRDPSTAKTFSAQFARDAEDPTVYQWAIELKEIGEAIGSISVTEKNELADRLTIGYCIGSRWWGLGLMPEALKKVTAYLFEEVGVKRIELRHAVKNPKSGRVMQKCGYTFEGTLRQSEWCNAGIQDMACYSMLREEYFAKKEE